VSFIKKGIGRIKEIGRIIVGSKKDEIELQPIKKFCRKCSAELKDLEKELCPKCEAE